MRDLLVDVTRLLGRLLENWLPTGVDRVNLEYIRHFGHRAHALVRFGGRWLVIGADDSERLFKILLAQGNHFSLGLGWLIGRNYVLNWRQPTNGSILLNVGHSGLETADYAKRVRRHKLRPLYFLHDLIPISHPEYCRPGEADRHHRRLATMLHTGYGLVLNSAATGDELEEYASRHGLPRVPMTIASLAPGKLPTAPGKRPMREPYFVMLGTIEPRKNHLLLLHAWRRLVDECPDPPRLILIGKRGWECEQVIDLLERCEVLNGFVVELPGCDDVTLASWLRHAQALLFPSFAEGFGMPIVEALMLGTPVIASDLPVFREFAGEVPEYVDPLDGARWIALIEDYALPESASRSAQLGRLTGFRPPTWAQHMGLVDEFLERLEPASSVEAARQGT